MWFLCAASVLALFDITKAVDDEGNVIQPDCEFNSIGTIRYNSTPLIFFSNLLMTYSHTGNLADLFVRSNLVPGKQRI